MIWKSHRLVTFMGVLAVTENPLAAFFATSGAVFPDYSELPFMGLLKHRTITHWFPIYLIPALVIYFLLYRNQGLWMSIKDIKDAYQLLDGVWFLWVALLNYTFWFLVGCLCHIAEDLLTGYVPILGPTDERKLHIFFYPGSPNEYIFDLLFTVCCVALKVPYIQSLLK